MIGTCITSSTKFTHANQSSDGLYGRLHVMDSCVGFLCWTLVSSTCVGHLCRVPVLDPSVGHLYRVPVLDSCSYLLVGLGVRQDIFSQVFAKAFVGRVFARAFVGQVPAKVIVGQMPARTSGKPY